MKLETMLMPVVSTGHLTKDVADRLTSLGDTNDWVICAPYENGFFLWISHDQDAELGMPQCLKDVRDAVSKYVPNSLGIWVRLDCDGGEVDAPIYEW